MKLTLEVDLSNEAFYGAPEEVCTVLKAAGDAYYFGSDGCFLYDINGNKVGEWRIEK